MVHLQLSFTLRELIMNCGGPVYQQS